MPNLVFAAPLFYVQWSCRRCGHTGGIAKTTVPMVTPAWTEVMMRELLDSLRRKLARVHQRQGCIAVADDFLVERFVPDGKTLLDTV